MRRSSRCAAAVSAATSAPPGKRYDPISRDFVDEQWRDGLIAAPRRSSRARQQTELFVPGDINDRKGSPRTPAAENSSPTTPATQEARGTRRADADLCAGEPADSPAPAAARAPKKTSSGRWKGKAVGVREGDELCYDSVVIDDETFSVGDVVLLDAGLGSKHRWLCKIDALWQASDGEKLMEARWYYRPDECRSGRLPGHDRREVFESVHSDTNNVSAIDGHARLMEWEEYREWLAQPAEEDEDVRATTRPAPYPAPPRTPSP